MVVSYYVACSMVLATRYVRAIYGLCTGYVRAMYGLLFGNCTLYLVPVG